MSNLTADAPSVRSRKRDVERIQVTDAVQLYYHSLVAIDPSTGRAKKWADASGLLFKGMAMAAVLGATGDSPIPEVAVDTSGLLLEKVSVANGAGTVADVGKKVYCATDNVADLDVTAGTYTKPIGRIVKWHTGTTYDVLLFTPEEHSGQALIADITALTDSSGGAAADNTIGAVTPPSAETDSTGGSASTTLAAITTFTPSVAWNGSSVYPSAADATAIAAAITSAKNSLASLAARQAENRTAIIALTDAVTELATKVNAILTRLNAQQ